MDNPEEDDFQEVINVPRNIYTRKRERSYNSSDNREPNDEDSIEASLCTLCQCHWTNNGVHGIVGLKCGHLFGKNCIDQYIRDSISKVGFARCPVCDNNVTKSEPRRIWPNKVIQANEDDLRALKLEHTEADKVLQDLVEANMDIKRQIEEVKAELNKLQSSDMLKLTVAASQASMTSSSTIELSGTKSEFIYQRTFSLPNEKYRVMDLNSNEDMAVLSVAKNHNQIFGLRKINLYDSSLTEFIPNHSGQIKDLKHAFNNMVLSTGLDKTLKLTSLTTNQVVQSYQLDAPGWSCATDLNNPSVMYCGLTNNSILVFDIRNTKESVLKLIEPCTPRIFSPIHSMSTFSIDMTNLLVCSNLIHSYCWSIDRQNETLDYKYDLLEQTMNDNTDNYKNFAMAYNDNILFTSLRNKSSTRYEVAHFDNNDKLIVDWYFDDINHKQQSLSRNTHFKRADADEIFICISDTNTVKIRNKVEQVQMIQLNESVVDIKHIKQDNNNELLAILTEDELQTYKFE